MMILIFHIYPEGTDFNHVLKFVSPPVPYLSERDAVFWDLKLVCEEQDVTIRNKSENQIQYVYAICILRYSIGFPEVLLYF